METARPESVIPARAAALFPEAEFKLHHPLLQAMPYPHGADPRLMKLEKFVTLSLDPETTETLRHSSIRNVGRWLNESIIEAGGKQLLTDFYLLLDRTPWSVDRIHAFAIAYLRANGIRIEWRHKTESDQRAFKLVQGRRTLALGEPLGTPFPWCMQQFEAFFKNYPWTEGVTLETSACFKVADLLFLYVQHGLPARGEWPMARRLNFMQNEGYFVWTALSLALSHKDRAAQMPSPRESLEHGMHDVVIGQIEEALSAPPEAPNREEAERGLAATTLAQRAQSTVRAPRLRSRSSSGVRFPQPVKPVTAKHWSVSSRWSRLCQWHSCPRSLSSRRAGHG